MRLTSARVHFQMRIFTKTIDLDESLFTQSQYFQRFSIFGSSIVSPLPRLGDKGLQFVA